MWHEVRSDNVNKEKKKKKKAFCSCESTFNTLYFKNLVIITLAESMKKRNVKGNVMVN